MSQEGTTEDDDDNHNADITTTEDQKWQWLKEWRRQECHRLQVPLFYTSSIVSTLRNSSLSSEERGEALRTIQQGLQHLQQQQASNNRTNIQRQDIDKTNNNNVDEAEEDASPQDVIPQLSTEYCSTSELLESSQSSDDSLPHYSQTSRWKLAAASTTHEEESSSDSVEETDNDGKEQGSPQALFSNGVAHTTHEEERSLDDCGNGVPEIATHLADSSFASTMSPDTTNGTAKESRSSSRDQVEDRIRSESHVEDREASASRETRESPSIDKPFSFPKAPTAPCRKRKLDAAITHEEESSRDDGEVQPDDGSLFPQDMMDPSVTLEASLGSVTQASPQARITKSVAHTREENGSSSRDSGAVEIATHTSDTSFPSTNSPGTTKPTGEDSWFSSRDDDNNVMAEIATHPPTGSSFAPTESPDTTNLTVTKPNCVAGTADKEHSAATCAESLLQTKTASSDTCQPPNRVVLEENDKQTRTSQEEEDRLQAAAAATRAKKRKGKRERRMEKEKTEWTFLRNDQGFEPHPTLSSPFHRRRTTKKGKVHMQCLICSKSAVSSDCFVAHACRTNESVLQTENMIVQVDEEFLECQVCCKKVARESSHIYTASHQQRLAHLQRNHGLMLVGYQHAQNLECRFACRFCQTMGLGGFHVEDHIMSASHVHNKAASASRDAMRVEDESVSYYGPQDNSNTRNNDRAVRSDDTNETIVAKPLESAPSKIGRAWQSPFSLDDSELDFLVSDNHYKPDPMWWPPVVQKRRAKSGRFIYSCLLCAALNIQDNAIDDHVEKCLKKKSSTTATPDGLMIREGTNDWVCLVCDEHSAVDICKHTVLPSHRLAFQTLEETAKEHGLLPNAVREQAGLRFRWSCVPCQFHGYFSTRLLYLHCESERHRHCLVAWKNKKEGEIREPTDNAMLSSPRGNASIEDSVGGEALIAANSSCSGGGFPSNLPHPAGGRETAADLQLQPSHTFRSCHDGVLQWRHSQQNSEQRPNDGVNSICTQATGENASSGPTNPPYLGRDKRGYILPSEGRPQLLSLMNTKRKSCSDIDETSKDKKQRAAERSARILSQFQANVLDGIMKRDDKTAVQIVPTMSYPLKMQLREDSKNPGTFSGLLQTRKETSVEFISEKVEPLDLVRRIERFDPFWKVSEIIAVSITSPVTNTLPPARSLVKSALQQCVCMSESAFLRIPTSKWGTKRKFNHGDSSILLRMYPLKPLKNLPDCHRWPKGTFLQVNGKPVAIQQRRQQAHNLNEWCGLSKPLHISNLLSTPEKVLFVQLGAADDQRFILTVTLCTYQSSNTLLKDLCNDTDSLGFRQLSMPVGLSKAIDFASKSLAVVVDHDDEDEVTIDDAKPSSNDEGKFILSLACPISRQRMNVPVRGRECQHFQCFDLFNFLSTNSFESGNRWRCASCERFLAVEDLELCGFTKSLLREFSGQPDRDRVEVHEDATYRLLPAKRAKRQATLSCTSDAPEVIIL